MAQDLSFDFHSSSKGYILSPAGYGKTETIVDSVAHSTKRQLVLTHTHAGVQSLRKRFAKKKISASLYHVDTIDSFVYTYLLRYPCAPFTASESPEDIGDDLYWSNIRVGFISLLDFPYFTSLLKLIYDGVYVDEYQDTSHQQHEIILKLSTIMPCRVVGDPYQSVFAFRANEIISWEEDVVPNFEQVGELTIPRRWEKTNTDLGNWLIDARRQIFKEGKLDLSTAPKSSVRILSEPDPRYGSSEVSRVVNALDSSIIITNWQAAMCHRHARGSGGLISSMEEMECKDLKKFSLDIDGSTATEKAMTTATFLGEIMTGAGKNVIDNLQKLIDGKSPKNAFILARRGLFDALLEIIEYNDYKSIHKALDIAPSALGGHVFRREIYFETLKSLSSAIAKGTSFADGVEDVRYRTRVLGRVPNKHSISRVLLIKGLEYKNAIILKPETMTAKELYVAITRPTHTLTVFCKNAVIIPKK